LTLASSLSVLATGRLELAILLPDGDKEAMNIVRIAAEFSFSLSCLFGLFFIVAPNDVFDFINASNHSGNLYFWLGPTIFAYAIYQLFNFWLLRKKAYWPSAINKISQTSITTSLNLILGLLQTVSGLVYSEVCGRLAGIFVGYYQSIKNGFVWPKLDFAERKRVFTRYKKFIYFSSVPAFLDSLSSNIPILFLTAWYAAETAGYFQLSRMVLTIPIALVSAAVSQVLLNKTIELKKDRRPIGKWYLRIGTLLLISFLPLFLLLLMKGEEIFGLIFGREWGQSGTFAAILAGAYLMRFVIAPLSCVFPAMENVKISGAWQVFYFLLMSGMIFLKGIDVQPFLYSLLVAEIVAYAVYLVLIINTIRRFDKSLVA
jgi:O-antigen/teichoic acid export membrane protein